MRNKDNHPRNFDGPIHLDNPKAKSEFASLRPDGSIAPRPQERMREGAKHHAYGNPNA